MNRELLMSKVADTMFTIQRMVYRGHLRPKAGKVETLCWHHGIEITLRKSVINTDWGGQVGCYVLEARGYEHEDNAVKVLFSITITGE